MYMYIFYYHILNILFCEKNCNLLFIVAVKTINQEYIEEGILDRISQKYNVSEEIIDEYYSIIFTILKIHLGTLSQNVKVTEFKQILEELKYVFYKYYILFHYF